MEAILIYVAILIVLGYIGYLLEKHFPKFYNFIVGPKLNQSDEQEQNVELGKLEPTRNKFYDPDGYLDPTQPHYGDFEEEDKRETIVPKGFNRPARYER